MLPTIKIVLYTLLNFASYVHSSELKVVHIQDKDSVSDVAAAIIQMPTGDKLIELIKELEKKDSKFLTMLKSGLIDAYKSDFSLIDKELMTTDHSSESNAGIAAFCHAPGSSAYFVVCEDNTAIICRYDSDGAMVQGRKLPKEIVAWGRPIGCCWLSESKIVIFYEQRWLELSFDSANNNLQAFSYPQGTRCRKFSAGGRLVIFEEGDTANPQFSYSTYNQASSGRTPLPNVSGKKLLFSTDKGGNKVVFCQSDNTLVMRDALAKTERSLAIPGSEPIAHLAYRPDGGCIAAVTKTNNSPLIILFDTKGEIWRQFPFSGFNEISSLSYSPCSRYLLFKLDKTVVLLDSATRRIFQLFRTEASSIELGFCPANNSIFGWAGNKVYQKPLCKKIRELTVPQIIVLIKCLQETISHVIKIDHLRKIHDTFAQTPSYRWVIDFIDKFCGTCAICLEKRADSAILECKHAFCESCFQGLETRNIARCPICRQNSTLIQGSIRMKNDQ
jgi:hypothetical protein